MTSSAAGFINEANVLANDYNIVPDPNTRVEEFVTNSAESVIRLCKRVGHTRIYITYNPTELVPDE